MANVPAKKSVPTLAELRKTPNQLAAETPEETAERYGIDPEVPEENLDNPNIQVHREDYYKQVPSSTHLHPDIAADPQNRGITEPSTDVAQLKRGDTYIGHVFATDEDDRKLKNVNERNNKE